MSTSELDVELGVYLANKDQLVATAEGKYVLVSGNEIKGVWDTYEDALQAGYAAVGLKPFLVKKIQGIEDVQFVSRDLGVCQS